MNSLRLAGTLLGLASTLFALGDRAKSPTPALLEWDDIQVIIYPDTAEGTLVVLTQWYRGTPPAHLVQFSAYLDPDSASAWIPAARTFLSAPAPAPDSSRVAVSVSLRGRDGETISFARRKNDSGWTPDRYLSIQNHGGWATQYVNISWRAADQFLDSLAAVVLRTPLLNEAQVHRSAGMSGLADTLECPAPFPDNRVPEYPIDERKRGLEGSVIASFIVTERGTVDERSLQIVFASREAFARAVRADLRFLRFDPAHHDGVPVSKRVIAPFMFQLLAPGERPPDSSRRTPSPRCGWW